MYHDIDGSWWIAMAAMMTVFWGIVIGFAVWAVQSIVAGMNGRESAIELARRRFASGEINESQFDSIRAGLGRSKEQGGPSA